MGKIIGAVLLILGIGAVGSQISHQGKPVSQQNQTPKVVTTSSVSGGKTVNEIKLLNQKYGSDARNTMNVYIPRGSSSTTPFVLFIHGGAWTMGDKNDVAIIQAVLGSKGIASAAMNYRYASKSVHYTELMSDVNNAVNYIVDHGKDWNVNTDKIAIGGISAGAHMAMLYAYKYDNGNHIDMIISMAGPSNLADLALLDNAMKINLITGVDNMVGANYVAGKQLDSKFTIASPIDNIRNIPTLLIHGTGDTVVPYDQSVKMDAALANAGVAHELVTIPNANHDLGLANPTTAAKISDVVVSWIKKYEK